jgi:xanthine dehydrogenase small subunit
LRNSCLTTLAMVAGSHVITAEGLRGDGPVHRALKQGGAVQCGYCSPGLAVALTWALLSGTDPHEAVEGNLCRCTGYGAIRRACALLPADPAPADLLPRPVLEVAAQLPAIADERLDGRPHVAGGTDVVPAHRDEPTGDAEVLVLGRVPELTRIRAVDGELVIGGAVTVAQLAADPQVAARWPSLPLHLRRFGSPAVRAAATVAGNLVNGSPAADLAPVLLVLGSRVELRGEGGSRTVGLEDFYQGYRRVDVRPGELVAAIHVPDPPDGSQLHLEKVAKRGYNDIASVSLAVLRTPDGAIRIAAGGVGATPLLLPRTAAMLGGDLSDVAVLRSAWAVLAAEVSPIDDLRGSAAYKRSLLQHLLLAALDDAAPGLAQRVLT